MLWRGSSSLAAGTYGGFTVTRSNVSPATGANRSPVRTSTRARASAELMPGVERDPPGQVDRDDLAGPGAGRGEGERAGAGAQVEDASALGEAASGEGVRPAGGCRPGRGRCREV